MIKYTSNSLLATLISFSNEIGNLCSALGGVDVVDVMQGVHLARYFTRAPAATAGVRRPITSFLGAGCGFGGSCLPEGRQGARRRTAAAARRGHAVARRRRSTTNLASRPGCSTLLDAPLPLAGRPARRRARPGLQAGHRRHARVAAIPHRRDAARSRRSRSPPTTRSPPTPRAPSMPAGGASCEHALEDASHGCRRVMLVTRWARVPRLPELLGLARNRRCSSTGGACCRADFGATLRRRRRISDTRTRRRGVGA